MQENTPDMAQIILTRQYAGLLQEAESVLSRLNPKEATKYLSTHDLMERWQCSYNHAIAFMHRKGSGAIKPAKKLLVSEKEVLSYENMSKARAGT